MSKYTLAIKQFFGLKPLENQFVNSDSFPVVADDLRKEHFMIRNAMTQDLREMAKLLSQLFAIEEDFQYDFHKQLFGLKLLYNDQSSQLFVAKYRNRVIGMLTLQEFVSTAQGGLSAQLEDLVVDEGYRGRGIGTLLLATAKDYARRNGFVRLQLATDKMNKPAVKFYKKRGFSATQLYLLHDKGGL